MTKGKLRATVIAAGMLAALCFGGAAVAQQAPAGTVVFVSGPVELVSADGSRKVVQAGAAIRAGEQVATGADGYAHVRMIDNAFVAVRPQSRLAVETYEYDATNPSASRIKLQLFEGNARTVSGKGGEAAKHNYRFNTPMAAIGLRGTDYTVLSSDSATRVSVARGAVAVTPLGGGCQADALGPCATGNTRELSASTQHAYLEVSAQNRVPVLVKPEQDPQGGSNQNPQGRPEEPRADNRQDLKSKDAASQVAADKIALALSTPPEVVTPPPPPPPAQFVWGRWSTYAKGEGSPAITALLDGKREIVYSNEVFGLLRNDPIPRDIPSQGAFAFQLAGGEAYSVSQGVATPAQVNSGTFGLDFSKRTFETTLSVQHAQGTEQLSAKGNVQFQGLFVADPARSNMNLAGAVSGDGTQAAYLFDKLLASGSLLGVVRWVR
ncbi:FecR family protein [Ramlibacter sp. PS4R-6]|uniref:FecR family protein n=1 Tax=Ramlibacter sp. PS4R-6 TaxID=3133438 RepID=UPI00309FA9A8